MRPGPGTPWLARRFDRDAPTGLFLTAGAAGTLAFLLGFFAIARGYAGSTVFAIDTAVYRALVAAASPALTKVMWVATLCGDARVMWAESIAVVVALLVWRRPRRALFVGVVVGSGSALANLLKDHYVRPRPQAALALIEGLKSFSFPSGHANAALLLCGSLALLLLASRRPAWLKAAGVTAAALATILVGLSRIYLGVHWFSDVVGSWFLAGAFLSATGAALLAWERSSPSQAPPFSGRAAAWRWAVTLLLGVIVGGVLVAETAVNPLL